MNKRVILFGVFVFALCMAAVLRADSEKMILCFGDFQNKSKADNDRFNTLIDRMTNAIVNTRKFTVVDNARLKDILKERKKADMGLSGVEDAPKKGKIKTAGYTIYGTVVGIGVRTDSVSAGGIVGERSTAMVELNIRFSDVETGEVIASKTIKATKTAARNGTVASKVKSNMMDQLVQDTIEDAAKQSTEKLMELAFPTLILKVGKRNVTLNMTEERAKTGMLLEVFERGEEMKDPDTGESLGCDEELVGELKITRVSPKFAKAKPVGDLGIDDLEEGMIVRPVSEARLKERAYAEKGKKKKNFKRRF
jgi:curli biogenesis system outer membrane secretion channel CsgG